MDGDLKARRIAYQQAVRSLAEDADVLRAAGQSDEAIARALVARRNAMKAAFRECESPALVALIEARNLAKYGDPVGPGADHLFVKYGDWRAVIAAACRPALIVIE
ncbi:MAG: hypothetical protein K2Y20_10900 [Sphingomonas sp.]|nr:hypothetical protein [Sphingomonas sp.]